LVFICLCKLHSVGIRVVSLTMDGSSANCNMISHLGGNLDTNNLKCSFAHPEDNEPVFLFLDACHMLKLVRNMLADKRVLVDHYRVGLLKVDEIDTVLRAVGCVFQKGVCFKTVCRK